MTEKDIHTVFEKMSPDDTQKEHILNTILNSDNTVNQASKTRRTHRKVWVSTVAACLALAFTMIFMFQLGGGAVAFALSIGNPDGSKVKIMDNEKPQETTTVSNVNARPDLEFYIEGNDIAKIELSCESEYLYIVDWTETQDAKYWDLSITQEFDEETQQSVFHPERLHDKTITLTFAEDFTEYDQIWYRWNAWELYKWACEDNFSHFQGVGDGTGFSTENERLESAAGGNSSDGHILLDGYPKDKLSDKITITITDRQGNTVTKILAVNVRNNEIGQTVVTASLMD